MSSEFQPFLAVIKEIVDLHTKKAADYGLSRDPYANIRGTEDFGVPAWLGAIIRQNDKIQRVKAFVAHKKLVNESLRDSLIDNAVYAIIALVLYDETN